MQSNGDLGCRTNRDGPGLHTSLQHTDSDGASRDTKILENSGYRWVYGEEELYNIHGWVVVELLKCLGRDCFDPIM